MEGTIGALMLLSLSSYFSLIRNHSKTLVVFASGQLAVQFINLLVGFCIIRWMPKSEYAMFTVAFSVQTTFGMLVEMGLSSALLAFIGNRANDESHVLKYYNAVIYWRKRLFILIIPVSLLAFCLLVRGKGWEFYSLALLYMAVPAAIYYQGFASFYNAILQIKKDVSTIYRVQVLIALVKMCVVALLFALGLLAGWIYLLLTAALVFVTVKLLREKTALPLGSGHFDKIAAKEILDYVKPTVLGIAFSAMQSQITIFLISIFGNTNDIADMGALGRLAQLFLLLNAFNGVILQPWFARMQINSVLRNVTFVQLFLGGGLLLLVYLSFLFPQLFSKLLGKNYYNLENEYGLVILISAIGYLSGVFVTVGSARKWIFWWPNIGFIVIFFICLFTSLMLFNVRTLRGVIQYSLLFNLTNFAMLLVYFFYGLHKERKASQISSIKSLK